jgi:(4S)-4-hydroxy-5-phosphonooxypentane-2,3-dione isomerase
MFAIFASISIKPERREQFISTIADTAQCSVRDEPACVRFDVFQDAADEDRYNLYEINTDEATVEAHLATPHAKHAMEGSQDFTQGPFDVTRANSVFPVGQRAYENIECGK